MAAPTTTPIVDRIVSPGRTEDVEALDRPGADGLAADAALMPGRHLLVEQGGETRRFSLTRPVKLHDGDVIVLGRAVLVYRELLAQAA